MLVLFGLGKMLRSHHAKITCLLAHPSGQGPRQVVLSSKQRRSQQRLGTLQPKLERLIVKPKLQIVILGISNKSEPQTLGPEL